jgi:spore germination cell wall hydrolase CwlJ-like protein
VTFNNLVTDSSTSAQHQNSIINKEEVNMKKIVLITLLGLCSLVFASNDMVDGDIPFEPEVISKVPEKQVECLAKNMYFEARSEPEAGIKAVGFVTMNRVQDSYFPKSICDVVYQRTQKVCQFSWVCIYGKNPLIRNQELFARIKEMAREIATHHPNNTHVDPSQGSLFFHAAYLKPGWKLNKKVRIGQHIFYSRKKNDPRS